MGNSKKDHVSTQVNYDCEDPFVQIKKKQNKKTFFSDTKVSPFFLSFFISFLFSFLWHYECFYVNLYFFVV